MEAIHWCFLQLMASTSQFQATNLQLINDEQNTKTHPKTHKRKCTSTRKLDPANHSKNMSVAYLFGGRCHVLFLLKETCVSHNVGTWRQVHLSEFRPALSHSVNFTRLQRIFTINLQYQKTHCLQMAKKSPTGPTERTPKQPEYLIALATY